MTTTPSTTTGSISSAGLGSGLDVKGIISSLMAVEAQPLQLLQDKASTVSTEISAVGQIQSLTSTMADKASALQSTSLWTQTTSSTSDSSIATADTSGGTAAAGDYSVSVQQLAQGQTATLATPATALSAGTLTIQLGTYTTDSAVPPNTTFSPSGAASPSITIGPGDTSLASIRDKINAAGAGVSASIINDASGSRLSLRSTTTGATNGFQITATPAGVDPDPTASLAALNFDATTGATSSQMSLNQFAQNAKATVNGIAVSSTTNTLSNISDGLSLTLSKVSATPVDITVSSDTASMQKAITDFVSAYSALQSYISLETKYDSTQAVQPGTARQDSPLTGDASVIGFQNQLRAIVNTTSTTSTMFARLSDIGIAVQTDGTLAVGNSTKLTSALQHPDELSKLFATSGTTNENTGIAVRFANLGQNAITVNGTLYSRADGLRGELSRNQTEQDNMQTHLDATQARLTAQYQALDTTMSQMSALSSYVSQQVSLMEK